MSAPVPLIEDARGGVAAPLGFKAGTAAARVKPGARTRPPRDDIALIICDGPATAAATFTTNSVKAAPVKVSAAHLKASRTVRAVILNSGNANACTGLAGIEAPKRMARATAEAIGCNEREVLVCSTGRIGIPLPIRRMEQAIARLPKTLRRSGSHAAARAIMTSDTFPKECAVSFKAAGRTYTVGGIAKGAGMIDPNMATMLAVVTTDAPVRKAPLRKALLAAVDQSFNRITVDGDMSTNDTVFLLASGRAGGPHLEPGSAPWPAFRAALDKVTRRLARQIVEDGEGVSKFVEVTVRNASRPADARRAAEAIANSKLVKCAWFGGDPNWGRIMDAVGYSGARAREELIDIYYDGVAAARNGTASPTPPAKLRAITRRKRFAVTVDLNMGAASHTVLTTDLTPEYVEFNKGE